MSYQVLARKWRPRTFSELVGQEHIARALSNALDAGRLHHAFLFTGTRGVGKTTLARILAKALNCETGVTASPCGSCGPCQEIDAGRFVDLIEVDAASRAKVDETRELLDNVQYAPSRGRYKVYLIDEVHMFSNHSFNALLKTLEEPPPHVKFLLATTDPQKLPVTVLSRCLQFNLRRLPGEAIAGHLRTIAGRESADCEPQALRELARAAEGSMRDALSLLDQALAFGNGRVTARDVAAMLGLVDRGRLLQLAEALAAADGAAVLSAVAELDALAPDYEQLLADLVELLQRLALLQAYPETGDESFGDPQAMAVLASAFSPEDLQLFYQIALLGRRDLPLSPHPRGGFEMLLLRMLVFRPEVTGQRPAATPVGNARQQLADVLRRPAATDPGSSGSAQSDAGEPRAEPGGPGGEPAEEAGTVQAPPPDSAAPRNPKPPLEAGPPGPAASAAPAGSATAVTEIPDWGRLLKELTLKGISRELARHCELQSYQGQELALVLDEGYRQLRSERAVERLQEALRKHLASPRLRLRISVQGTLSATPARRQQEQESAQRAAAEQAIENDPNVQALRKRFGASIRPGSIMPR